MQRYYLIFQMNNYMVNLKETVDPSMGYLVQEKLFQWSRH